MLANARRNRIVKKKIGIYVFLFGLLAILGFLIYLNILLKSSRFISPLGNSADFVKVEKILKEKNILFSSVVLLGSSYIVNIANNGQVRLSSQKNIGQQIASLQRILRALTIEGKSFKNIDFRFKEPIISF